MANKKINELSVRTPSLSDLMLVGDPSTGYSYKATISSLSTLLEANIALNDLSDVVITSVANGNLLAYNGTNWVNRTLGAYLGGTITQYVRGDGSLGDFSGGGGGGGSSVSYYLNGSVNQGTFVGTTYYEMNKTAIIGAGTDFTINANGYIASFITDAGDPALLKIPGGNWNLELYFSASSAGGTPSFYVELYKYDGTTFTLIASNSGTPEGITNGTAIDAYFTSISVPETVLTLTDRLAIRVYVTHSGRTITLHTENSHLCQIITTFTTGLTALNNLTAQVQYLVTGTSGTDFAISSTTATHTFNLPTASGTNRGALSSADWTTFNGKVGGSGTTNYVSKFTASGTIGNSQIFDNGTSVGIGTASPSYKLDVIGDIRSSTGTYLTSATAGTAQGFANNGIGLVTFGLNTSGNALVVNDIDGAKFAFSTGGFNTTFYKHRSTDNKYYPTFVIKGSGATSYGTGFDFYVGTSVAATITSNGRLLLGTTTESTYELDVVGDIRSTLDANINGLTVGKGGGSVSENTAFGVNALASNTTGSAVTAVGYLAGNANTVSNHNTYIGTRSGSSATGQNNTFLGSRSGFSNTTGTQNTFLGTFAGYDVTTGISNTFVGYLNPGITTGNYNTIIGANVTGLSSSLSNTIILADGQGNQRLYINSSGNVGIGTTSPSYLLDVNGTARVSGTELRLDNGTTGTINLYSNTPRVNFFSGGGYSIGRNATAVELISAGNIALYIGANQGYGLDATNGHLFRSAIAGGASLARLTTGGNLIVGGTTDAGYRADIQGTFRSNHNGYGIVLTSTTGNRLQWIDNGTFRWAIGSQAIQGGELANSFNFYSATNSATQFSIASDGAVMIGVPYPISSNYAPSAQLQVASTTKGFLPPRMTGAQAEAITGPAAGLMVYSTDGSGATITSLGWWGFNGTTWVKLN